MVAYTIIPAFIFLNIDLENAAGWVWIELRNLNPTNKSLGLHLWRQDLYLLGVVIGYLLFRGYSPIPKYSEVKNRLLINNNLVFMLLIFCITVSATLIIFSDPVSNYIESYTRYDHLNIYLRKFISLLVRLKSGILLIAITFLFINSNKGKKLLLTVLILEVIFEFIYSFGSRIEVYFIIMMSLFLYDYFIKKIPLKFIFIFLPLVGSIFTIAELARSYDFDPEKMVDFFSGYTIQPASEFGSVFITGYHLYLERSISAIPAVEWPMLYSDFINLVMPNDFVKWNPQSWYANAYYSNSEVPPATIGPIADSAIWGGEIDLFLRALLSGAIFGCITRWFVYNCSKWWAIVLYAYCYGTSIMAIKYSPLYMLNPLIKTFIIDITIILIIIKIYNNKYLLKKIN